jgi:uncharacterized protein YicC (UPF0701 family)
MEKSEQIKINEKAYKKFVNATNAIKKMYQDKEQLKQNFFHKIAELMNNHEKEGREGKETSNADRYPLHNPGSTEA